MHINISKFNIFYFMQNHTILNKNFNLSKCTNNFLIIKAEFEWIENRHVLRHVFKWFQRNFFVYFPTFNSLLSHHKNNCITWKIEILKYTSWNKKHKVNLKFIKAQSINIFLVCLFINLKFFLFSMIITIYYVIQMP